ncbi:MAG: glycoside hydrolase [Deltaproteobacteria bacterium]|nr:glycoside hydrolase [Deltaproteobacteria bacterium]
MSSRPPVELALFWHMHQPWYIEPESGRLALPWVRMHAAGAYTDMAELLLEHPEVRATVNLSPSLIDQIHYCLEGGRDAFEELTLRPPGELSDEERHVLVRSFFSVHWGKVLEPMPRYRELLEKRGRNVPAQGFAAAAQRFSDRDLRDLQVLFNLASFGHIARRRDEVRTLLARGGDYREEDKALVLSLQRDLLSQVLPRWQRLVDRRTIELTASPYYHAILPLLIDSNVARRATPGVHLPARFCAPDDAELQIRRGIARVQDEFGVRPSGFWPSEGAVSPETVELAQRCGVRYLLSDESVLGRSLDDRQCTPGRRCAYQPYRRGECALVFRDQRLSERIAKSYSSTDDARAAAADFLSCVLEAADAATIETGRPPLVLVALDGENPWEAYPERGTPFLTALYEAISTDPRLRTVTVREHLERHPPTLGLDYLHSGSWIEANFTIWIGDPETNRAWELLGRARTRLQAAEESGEEKTEALAAAREHLLRAEASDFFWWLGEPFFSAEDPIYEALFRSHLVAVYGALGESPPADLLRPVSQGGVVAPVRQPSRYIQPRLDGTRTSFYEWQGAGLYRVPLAGTDAQHTSFIAGVYWGFDASQLFLRCDPAATLEGATVDLHELDLQFELATLDRTLTARVIFRPRLEVELHEERRGQTQSLGTSHEVACAEVIELALPLARLSLNAGARAGLSVRVGRRGEPLSRVPFQGVIEVEVPAGATSVDSLPEDLEGLI